MTNEFIKVTLDIYAGKIPQAPPSMLFGTIMYWAEIAKHEGIAHSKLQKRYKLLKKKLK